MARDLAGTVTGVLAVINSNENWSPIDISDQSKKEDHKKGSDANRNFINWGKPALGEDMNCKYLNNELQVMSHQQDTHQGQAASYGGITRDFHEGFLSLLCFQLCEYMSIL